MPAGLLASAGRITGESSCKESDSFEIAETLLQNMGDFFQQEQSKSHIKELDD